MDFARCVIHVREVLTEVKGQIKRKIYPKSDAGLRTVPITGLALRVLRELLADEPDASTNRSEADAGLCPAELVFHGRNKIRRGTKKAGSEGEPYRAPLRRSAFRRLWTKALQDSGVGRTKTKKVMVEETDPQTGRTRKVEKGRAEHWPAFHDQRHSFASRLHARGVPEVIAQEILGHERAGKVTWLYTHAAADYAGQVLAALEDKKPGRIGGKKPLRLVA
ncbi:tyrosine-type recombinase/integrase [Streptomyces sp. NPDC002809]|uniref:tyrosine-type recombinase/integrase n=1 Tax=Streptomyces sp. NPDC002809 TaxID=3154433 RepID=UPI003333648D